MSATPDDSRPPGPPAPDEPAKPAVALAPDERDRLLDLARMSLAVAVGARAADALQAVLEAGPLPSLRAGAFVTLTEAGRLRGCMGILDDQRFAWQSVVEAARLAALGDPRFATVAAEELAAIHVEVSVLGPMTPLGHPAAFRPGVDGLLIELGGRRGLLLPEVAGMLEPRHDAMLDAVCHKAGLPRDTWCGAGRDPRITLLVFQTCRFGGDAA